MRTDDLDFELPADLIAQEPAETRAQSRLLHYRRDDRSISHRRFAELDRLLRPGDVLVFNDTRVLPARFTLRKATGGLIEGLFLAEVCRGRWRVLLRGLEAYRGPLRVADAPEVVVNVVGRGEDGEYELVVPTDLPAAAVLDRWGRMPLPPYIRRRRRHDDRDEMDRQRYQTVFARLAGAVAAPTAGLHFDPQLLGRLDAAGIQRTFITLHVGAGTFRPVQSATLEQHKMHAEAYRISPEAAEALNQARRQGRRIVAVGTTSARVLESQPADEPFRAIEDRTSIFIYPPYRWKHVGAMITNFHLPRSTLIAMVAAMVGLEQQRRIYQEAINQRYRFFSYGDAMLIE